MSEYQYYEFLAIDQPLNERQQAAVRSLSTRARISATSFVNEYHWGDFSGDPDQLMERYYDAHVYVANWGTRRLMFRLPHRCLDLDAVRDYCVDHYLSAWTADEFLVLSLESEDEPDEFDLRGRSEAGGSPHRNERLPISCASTTICSRARPGRAHHSPRPRTTSAGSRTGVTNLSATEKNALLSRVVQGHGMTVRMELLRRFRDEQTTTAPPRRTVADLLDNAARLRANGHSRT